MPRPNNAKGSSNRRGNSTGKPFGKKDDSSRSDFKKSNPKKSFSKKSEFGSAPRPKSGSRGFGKKSDSDGFKSGPSKSRSREDFDRPFKKSSSSRRNDSSSERPFKSSGPRSGFKSKPFGAKSDESSGRPFKSSPKKGFRSDLGKGSFGGKSRFGSEKFEKPFTKKSEGDGFDQKKSRPVRERGETKEPSSFQGKRVNRKDSQRGNPNYGLPFKRKQGGDDGFDAEKPTRRVRSEASFKPGSKRGKKFDATEDDSPKDKRIRLNKFIANSGVCSRREADELITMGLISVNGKVITELGYKVNPGDEVRHENKVLRAEKPVYILLNKPKGYLTTTTDPQERNTVMDIIGGAVKERIYPVGRLDRNTTGLLLFTNDGDLAERLMHPSYNIKKIYKAELDRPLNRADLEKIMEGVQLEEGRAMVDDVAIVSDDGKTVGLEIHIGWNRVVRRIFEALDYTVVKLDRSVYAGIDKKDLPRGHWRFLTKEEVIRLKHY
ncbi:pseudouridine synthase [Pseudochryseolinea flava]|uniref:Pseudouridine synthase n=1 Tax=Pseudochryseolinea flava TaxID=2059302 RepID=A0A364YAH6_9BACT|nr:pseudouridine synthase [Pseudochryseolinea flava]RAW03152.1 hypothetical protein DQQ10_03380 [Pseudochryseolinea flava]